MCYIIDVFFMDEHTLSKITKTYAKESPYQAGDFFVYILFIYSTKRKLLYIKYDIYYWHDIGIK